MFGVLLGGLFMGTCVCDFGVLFWWLLEPALGLVFGVLLFMAFVLCSVVVHLFLFDQRFLYLPILRFRYACD